MLLLSTRKILYRYFEKLYLKAMINQKQSHAAANIHCAYVTNTSDPVNLHVIYNQLKHCKIYMFAIY